MLSLERMALAIRVAISAPTLFFSTCSAPHELSAWRTFGVSRCSTARSMPSITSFSQDSRGKVSRCCMVGFLTMRHTSSWRTIRPHPAGTSSFLISPAGTANTTALEKFR
ncbi:hypothetical protein FQZ97_1117380 [compost metagenome]